MHGSWQDILVGLDGKRSGFVAMCALDAGWQASQAINHRNGMAMRQAGTIARIFATLVLGCASVCAVAADDEIQVYADDLNKPGEAGVELHVNYVTVGSRDRAWTQQVPSRDLFRVTPEFNYGLTEKVDAGLYLPMTKGPGESAHLEGAKVRLKYLELPEGNGYYWGVNFEVGRLSLRTVEQHWNHEIRPIIGYRDGGWNFAFNPRLSGPLSGGASRVPEFNPCFRIIRDVGENWAIGVEHYSEFGPVNHFLPASERSHNTYLVFEGKAGETDINFGIGKGWTGPSDRVVIKAIFGFHF